MLNDFLRARIKNKFEYLKKQDASFTLRLHAQQLGISPGAYSDFLAGKRKFSDKKVVEIARKLPLDASEESFMALLSQPDRQTIEDHEFVVIKEWYHFAILAILECDDPPNTSLAIAERLNIDVALVDKSLEKLVSLNLLIKNFNGTLSLTGLSYFTKDGAPSEVIKEAHREGLKQAAKALDEVSVEERDFTYLTFSASTSQMKKAKKEIRRCLDKVSQIMSHPEKDQVYRISIQLYPLLTSKDKK